MPKWHVTYPCIICLITHDVDKDSILKLLRHALELSAEHFARSAALRFAHENYEFSWIVLNDILILF